MARIAPLNPSYAPDIQATFDAIMPAGVQPLVLFRTLGQYARLWRLFAGGLFDQRPAHAASPRDRDRSYDGAGSTAANTNGASISPSSPPR